MRSVGTIWFFLFFCAIAVAQKNTSALLKQAENALYSDPPEAIRIAEYISEKSGQPETLLKASYILTRAFYMEGNYDKALKIGMEYSAKETKSTTNTQLLLNILLSKILKELEISSLAFKYNEKAKKSLNTATDSDIKNWVMGKSIQYGIEKKQTDSLPGLNQLYIAKSKLKKKTSSQYPCQIGNIDLEIGAMHLREFNLDSAQYYFACAFRESKKEKKGNYLEMKALINYGEYFFLKKAYAEAIDTLKSAMLPAEKFTNLPEQIAISEAIAKNYLAMDDLKNFNSYNYKAEALSVAMGDAENNAVNTAYNFYNTNHEKKFDARRAAARRDLWLLAGVFSVIFLFWAATKLRYRTKIMQYRKFLEFLGKRKKPIKASVLPKEDTSKAMSIPKDTEEQLLVKLEDFENSLDYTNKEISLSRMALQFGTNTKYLSELIKVHKQKNFNTYINELRINYITDKLNNDPQFLQYKISYLAEYSGFSSHSVFATVFKSVAGISPTTFITLLQNKQESPTT